MTRTFYDTVIAHNADQTEFIVLWEVFEFDSGFKGATGAVVQLVNEEQYSAATTIETLEEHFEDLWRQDAGSDNGTTDSLTDWLQDRSIELMEVMFEPESVVEEYLDENGIPYAATNIIEAGRIFPAGLEGMTILQPDLVEVVNAVESAN